MKHVVLFSGGIGSWAAAKRVWATMPDELILLFTDTKTEDEDLYRFINEAAVNVQGELVTIADGRDVWEVFFDNRMIGNTRADICSRVLKREPARKWINENVDPDNSTIYLGVDWSEIHRYEKAKPHWLPYTLKAPLTEPPLLTKQEMLQWATEQGLRPPRLYEWSPHNNCGGACVKAGIAQFAALLLNMPERYAYWETKEQEFRDMVGKDVAILRDRTGGTTKPLTLGQLRQRIEAGGEQLALADDWGGCGCMVDFNDEPTVAAALTPQGDTNGT